MITRTRFLSLNMITPYHTDCWSLNFKISWSDYACTLLASSVLSNQARRKRSGWSDHGLTTFSGCLLVNAWSLNMYWSSWLSANVVLWVLLGFQLIEKKQAWLCGIGSDGHRRGVRSLYLCMLHVQYWLRNWCFVDIASKFSCTLFHCSAWPL